VSGFWQVSLQCTALAFVIVQKSYSILSNAKNQSGCPSYLLLNVSKVNGMTSMFQNTNMFNQDISRWNVAQSGALSHMFENAKAFNQDLSGWILKTGGLFHTDFAKGATAWTKPKPNFPPK
jgi:hypothetical protein